jgi:hypothetical protein
LTGKSNEIIAFAELGCGVNRFLILLTSKKLDKFHLPLPQKSDTETFDQFIKVKDR